MNDLIEFLTSQEIIIVYCIAALACVICLIVYIIEKNNDNIRKRHNTKELNKLVDIIKENYIEEEEEEKYQEPVLTVMPDIKVETPLNSMLKESIQIEVKENPDTITLEPLPEQLIEEVKEPEKELIDVQKIKITDYEEEQERTAIISLNELLAKSKEMYESNEITQYKDEGNEPISIHDLEEMTDRKASIITDNFEMTKVVSEEEVEEEIRKEEVLHMDDIATINETNVNPIRIVEVSKPKFHSSPIISPIFGIAKEPTNTTSIALENTANYDKLDEEIRKSNEFVMSLKELQEKLE